MSISYQLYADKNGDGFINTLAQPSDPPNLLPTPVTYNNLPIDTDGSNMTLRWKRDDFDYGTHHWFIIFLSSAGGTLFIGTSNWAGGEIHTIPVTVGQPYTVALWLRSEEIPPANPLSVTVYDQNQQVVATKTPTLTTTWQQVTLSFTPSAGVTHICLSVGYPAGGFCPMLYIAGAMLVAGLDAPAVFNSGDDLNDNISDDVLEMRWRLGLDAPDAHVAAPTTATLTVDNASGDYSPQVGSLLQRGTRMCIEAQHNATTYRLLTGFIAEMSPVPGQHGSRTAQIQLQGADALLDELVTLAPLFTNTTADGVIGDVLNNSLINDRFHTDLDSGVSSFAYVADTWRDGIPATVPIQQVAEAERGRFYLDRRGWFIFKGRDYGVKVIAPAHTLSDDFDALDYTHGANLANLIRVMIYPRSVGTAGTILWTLANAQKINAGLTNIRTITAHMRDANDNPVGAVNIITPIAGVDYAANSAPDGSGSDLTASVQVTVIKTAASAVTLQIRNNSATTAYLLPGARLRGTPLIQGDRMVIDRRDLDSIDAHGLHTLTINLPHLVSAEEADALALFELERRKTPAGIVREVTLSADRHADAILARTLLDHITITEAQTGHTATYFIVGEAHTVTQGGAVHRTTWTLAPVNPAGYWQLDSSGLGTSTRLGLVGY